MNELIKLNPQIPAERIVIQVKEVLADADWKTTRRLETAVKVYERSAQVLGLKDHMKALKQAKLWAERKIGELLQDMEKAKGGRPHKITGTPGVPVISTYAELGITKKQASKCQKIAGVDEKIFQQIVEETPSVAAVLKTAAPETPPPTATVIPPSNIDDSEPGTMNPSMIETVKNLLQCLQKFEISEKTIILYLYYCAYGSTSPTQTEIKGHIRLSEGAIRKHNKVLEILGGIKREKHGLHTKVTVFNVTPLSPSSSSLLLGVLDLRAHKEYARKYASDGYARTRGDAGFSVEDIVADEDYQKAKVSLDKYFKEFEIDPAVLLTKNRFAKLVELVSDDAFNFEAFCKWFHREKYPDTKFGFGIFLYPNVIAEFLDTYKREGQYLRTSPGENEISESRRRGQKKTQEYLDTLPDDDEELEEKKNET